MAYAYMSADFVFIPTEVVLPLRAISKAKNVNQILFDFYYQYSKFSVLGLWFYDCRVRSIGSFEKILKPTHWIETLHLRRIRFLQKFVPKKITEILGLML